MKKFCSILPWCIVCASFFAFSLFVRKRVPASFEYELLGYDYGKYSFYFSNFGFISYFPFRHPLLGVIMAPVINFGTQIAKISITGYYIYIHLIFSAFGTCACMMVKKLSGWLGVCIFISIPFIWIAVAAPESYALSMCVLLLTVWWVVNNNKYEYSASAKITMWVVLFVIAGGVTLTNGIKVLLAYVLSTRLSRRQWRFLIGLIMGILLAGIAFFAIRMMVWNAMNPEMPKTISRSMELTFVWIDKDLYSSRWLYSALRNFFAMPLTFGYSWALTWAIPIYLIVACELWLSRRETLTRVMLGMFSVDVAIHLICGWGLGEAWIFSPHWIWMIPIVGSKFVERISRHRAMGNKDGNL